MVPQNGPLFQKIRFYHFQTDIVQTSPLQKFERKRSFLRKDMDEKRLGPLISSNYVLTVICQQRRKYHNDIRGP